MTNILVTTSSFAENDIEPLDLLKKAGLNVVVNPYGRTLTENEISALVKEYDPIAVIAGVEPITRAVLSQSSRLKIISRCGVGMSNIDLDSAREFGVAVYNTPDALTESVAELAIALILNLLRRVSEADRNMRNGTWKKLMGKLLFGKTVGIVGCGRIGTKLAEYVESFGCIVIGYDPLLKSHDRIKLVPREELLNRSDIITLHLPVSGETKNMVDVDFLTAMKNESYIVNTARGELIDEVALHAALTSGKLAGAALDTFKNEPYSGPLSALDNVVLTSHMGSYAREAREIMEFQSVKNLLNGLGEIK